MPLCLCWMKKPQSCYFSTLLFPQKPHSQQPSSTGDCASAMQVWFVLNMLGFISLDTIGIPGNLGNVAILYTVIKAICRQNVTSRKTILGNVALANLLVMLSREVLLTLKTFWRPHHAWCFELWHHSLYLLSLSVSIVWAEHGHLLSLCFELLSMSPNCSLSSQVLATKAQHPWHKKNLSTMISLWCPNLLVCCTRLLYSLSRSGTKCTKEERIVMVFPRNLWTSETVWILLVKTCSSWDWRPSPVPTFSLFYISMGSWWRV